MSTLRDGDRLALFSRWAVDERLPKDQQTEFTPTPKQMLYGQRAELLRVVAARKDASGRVTDAFAEVELKESRGGDWSKPYVFPAINRTLEADKLYTLDPCPNEWYAYWCAQVVNGLCDWSPNVLYDRLVAFPPPGDGAGSKGQAAFLAGLDAFRDAGRLHDFEAGKREFIGRHARTPVLLVQGPPGTGKSYSTAFAVSKKGTVQAEVREHVEPGSLVCTDALKSYEGLAPEFVHEAVDHAVEYVRGNVHTNGMENYWSLLKRTIRRTYVSVEPFHLFRYLDEQAFRFNERKREDDEVKTDAERFIQVAAMMTGKRVTYKKLTGHDQELPPAP